MLLPRLRLLARLAIAALFALQGALAQDLAAADRALAAELLAHSNQARRQQGLGELIADAGLAAAATAHAREMGELGYFEHTSPVRANATLGQRVANAGSPLVEIGENLARMVGVPDAAVAERTVQGWLESPGHRRNLLQVSYNRVGFGVHRDPLLGLLIVQVLGWEPYPLASSAITEARNTTTSMVLRFDSRSQVEVVLSFGGGTGAPIRLPAGISDVVLTPLSQDSELRVGVKQGGAYLYDEGATLHARAILASAGDSDPASAPGTFSLEPGAPRRHTRLTRAFAVNQTQEIVRAELVYEGAAAGALVVLFDDSSLTHTEIEPGRFEIELPAVAVARARERGVAEILVGIPTGDTQVRVFHRFEL